MHGSQLIGGGCTARRTEEEREGLGGRGVEEEERHEQEVAAVEDGEEPLRPQPLRLRAHPLLDLQLQLVDGLRLCVCISVRGRGVSRPSGGPHHLFVFVCGCVPRTISPMVKPEASAAHSTQKTANIMSIQSWDLLIPRRWWAWVREGRRATCVRACTRGVATLHNPGPSGRLDSLFEIREGRLFLLRVRPCRCVLLLRRRLQSHNKRAHHLMACGRHHMGGDQGCEPGTYGRRGSQLLLMVPDRLVGQQ